MIVDTNLPINVKTLQIFSILAVSSRMRTGCQHMMAALKARYG